MQVDKQIVKQTVLVLKHLAKDLRTGEVSAAKVTAFSKLLNEYSDLIRLSGDDDPASGFYDKMEQEALEEINDGRRFK